MRLRVQNAKDGTCDFIEDACGEYRRPLSFQLGLFGQPPLEVHGERSDLEAEIIKKLFRKLEKATPKAKKSMPRGVWEVLGATLGRKLSMRLSCLILAIFGQARDAQNGGKVAELGAKIGPR